MNRQERKDWVEAEIARGRAPRKKARRLPKVELAAIRQRIILDTATQDEREIIAAYDSQKPS